ncbi:MAG: Gfo/Idh/MocA family protein [Mycobacteriales bacterium]
MPQIAIAVVGMGFGSDFAPIYARHPDVARVGIADTDRRRLDAVGDRLGIADRFATLGEVLASGRYDAVHLTTPVRLHTDQSVAVLEAGLHCACAVPMATTIEDLRRIISAQRAAGRNYMMMETMVYGREYLYAADLHSRGELGGLTFLRGFHLQDLHGYPPYWMSYPPMTYSTHALSPLLAISGARVQTVSCLGSGILQDQYAGDWENHFPLETAHFRLDKDNLAAEVTLSFFQTARQYQEGFNVYGDRAGVEWALLGEDEMWLHSFTEAAAGARREVDVQRIDPPDRADLLPGEIADFVQPTTYTPAGAREPITVGAGHGGSHPHLADEFVRSIVEHRPPRVDALTAANWTAPGIVGHASAQRDGALLAVPQFTEADPLGTTP